MEGYFRTTSYALVATAFLAVALTGTLDAISIALYSVALIVCYYRDSRGATRLRLREWMWRALSIAYVPFVFVDGAVISNRVLALVHMTLFVSAAKLFQIKRDRDWVFLYLIAFFQMLLAAGLTFNATFVASLAVFLFFFISTLAAFEIRRARREVDHLEEETVTPLQQPQRIKYSGHEPASPAKGSGRLRYLLGASVTQSIIVAALTLPFFFLIPRLGGGGVARGFGEGEAITGFSDRVELGQLASIKKSPRVVMRVHLDHKPPHYIRWRGVALENYDGRAWNLAKPEGEVRDEHDDQGVRYSGGDSSAKSAPFNYKHGLRVPGSHPVLLEQRIALEPIDNPTLFAAQRALWIQGPMADLTRDKHTGALSAVGLKGRTAYTVSSDVSVPSEQDLRLDLPAASPEEVRRLNLPPSRKLDPRISQLAHEITRNAPTPYDKARAIESYLKTEFRYTLDLKAVEGDPLAEFLFQTREGHCEYFATAMAIMLRTLEIPARIVNGFQMGEYNELNDMYTVRESDAHSWVEAYFPRTESWVEFDPTPSVGINDYSRGGILAGLRRYADALEVFWLDYIVTLDSDEQASIMVDLQHRLLKVRDRLLAYYTDVKVWTRDKLNKLIISRTWGIGDLLKLGTALAVLGISLVSLYIVISYRKRRGLPPTGYGPWWHRLFVLPMWRRRSSKDYRKSAVLFYEQMLAIARKAGLVKQPSQTPLEFAEASGLSPISEITRLYNRVRFGGGHLDDSETRRVSALLGELKQSLRRR